MEFKGKLLPPLLPLPHISSPKSPKKSHFSSLTFSCHGHTFAPQRGAAITWGHPPHFRPEHQVAGPRGRRLRCEAWVPPCQPCHCCSQRSYQNGAKWAGAAGGCCRCVTEPRRLGGTDGHGFPLAMMSTLATAPQSSQWCRTGRVGLCFSFFKTGKCSVL